MPRRPAFESKDRMYLTGSKFRFHCLRPWSRRGSCPKEQTLEMLLNTRANHKNNVDFSSINDLSVACPLAFSTFTVAVKSFTIYAASRTPQSPLLPTADKRGHRYGFALPPESGWWKGSACR